MSRGDLKTRILIVVLLATVSACSNEPRCDQSPRDRLPDSVILEKIRQYAFQRELEDHKGSLEDAVRDGRVKWSWKAAPGMKYPNAYGSRNVYGATAVIVTYNAYSSNEKTGYHSVPLSRKNDPGVFLDKRIYRFGFDACGNVIGGRNGIEREAYTK
jgi:hypothetical protein